MVCLPQGQGEVKPKRTAVQCHRVIALSLHSVNDLFFHDTALSWKLTCSGNKLLIGCALLATIEPFLAAYGHVYPPIQQGGFVQLLLLS